ncbi:hypothetical protein L226DRAFT_530266 [Lentinus tigrinus ALCF2SS1-7]|uniref:uncharacterized protein n=1 Tax=Lentinus tigrinus ALCF2SS1-7 TaxID=1328758 RepID=UPI00116601ED|nr:hypothetical protein L226DRAFT_530266 [Lentinus tigrinus ALCF2SS1-7]
MSSYDDSVADVEVDQLQALASSSATGIRPVTIRQLLDATRPHSDAKFSIGGIDIDKVSIVAQVVDVEGRSSSITYFLHDGTGPRLIAKQWLSDDGETLPVGHWGYAHVVGQLDPKAQPGSKNVLIVKRIRALIDPPEDQLSFHIFQAAYVSLCFERGPPPTSVLVRQAPRYSSDSLEPSTPRRAPTPNRAAGTSRLARGDTPNPRSPATPSPTRQHAQNRTPPQSPHAGGSAGPVEPPRHQPFARASVPSREASHTPIRPSAPVSARLSSTLTSPIRDMPAQGSSGGSRRKSGIKRDPYAHLTVLQRAILLQILNTQHGETGSDVFTISRGVAHHNPSAEQIGDVLDFLVNEGYIETTIDTGHYAIRTSHYPTNP